MYPGDGSSSVWKIEPGSVVQGIEGESVSVRSCVAVVLGLLVSCAGCGSEKAQVSGIVVRQDGSPVVNARISARDSHTRRAASAFTDAEGHFVLGTINKGDGIHPGTYRVLVVEDRGQGEVLHPRTISAKYENPNTSELTIEINGGEAKSLEFVLDTE